MVFNFVESGVMVNHEESLNAVVTIEINGQDGFYEVQLVLFEYVLRQVGQLGVVLDRFKFIY